MSKKSTANSVFFILHKSSPLSAHKHTHTHVCMYLFSPLDFYAFQTFPLFEVFIVTFLFYYHWNSSVLPTVHLLSVQMARCVWAYQCVCVFVCVHRRRLHWVPCEPLDGHKHKDTLINSLNVCGGEPRPRVVMHPCGRDGEESHRLWRARGRAVPGSSGVELVQTVLRPIVMQDNPKSGKWQQHQVVLSTNRRRRWTESRNRACWASPGGLRMSEQHQLTQEDIRPMCGG